MKHMGCECDDGRIVIAVVPLLLLLLLLLCPRVEDAIESNVDSTAACNDIRQMQPAAAVP